MTAPVYRFGNAELRPATRTLRVDGQEAAIGARAFDLLLVLVENRDRMLTKSELLDLVWPNLVVEENNLQVQVSTLRKLLGAKAISTIPGRGYRFVAPLADQAPAPPAPPPPAPPPAVQQALPALREQLVGRDAERALLVELLRSQRLVTVVGAGGIGKTSLALAAARELGWMFRERVCVAELAAVPSGEHLVDAVARALRIQLPAGAADPASVLAERLGDAPQLLVLDNCEHLTEAAATLARVLLDKAPQLHLMATSQEPLRLATEQLVRLPPLGVPAAGERGDPARHAALDLLQRRVQAQRPAFRLDESNLDDATAIVQQLDGLPLAVELAAARVPLLGMAGVRQNLDERLRLLASSARDLPSRHRTLRAMLDWSHALLSDDERTVFRRLGVCMGGFGLELAQAVAADATLDGWTVVDLLGSLVDKSMVVADPGALPRYRLLESARAYALDRLAERGELAAQRGVHARAVRDVLQQGAQASYLGRDGVDAWAVSAGPDADNLRSAIEWAAGEGHDGTLAIELANIGSRLLFQIGRYNEGVRWVGAVSRFVGEHTSAQDAARYYYGLATLGLHGGLSASERLHLVQRACELQRAQHDKISLMQSLGTLAYVLAVGGRQDEADAALTEAQALVDDRTPAMIRAGLGFSHGLLRRYQDRHEEGLRPLQEALPLARQNSNSRLLFYLLNNIAAIHHELGHVAEAVSQYRGILALLSRLPAADSSMFAFAHLWLAMVHLDSGDAAAAAAEVRAAMPHVRRTVGVRHFALPLSHLAALQGRAKDAAQLLGVDDLARERRGEPRMPFERRREQAVQKLLSRHASEADLGAWRLIGRGLDDDATQALADAAATAS